jgi:hypothetical protein
MVPTQGSVCSRFEFTGMASLIESRPPALVPPGASAATARWRRRALCSSMLGSSGRSSLMAGSPWLAQHHDGAVTHEAECDARPDERQTTFQNSHPSRFEPFVIAGRALPLLLGAELTRPWRHHHVSMARSRPVIGRFPTHRWAQRHIRNLYGYVGDS